MPQRIEKINAKTNELISDIKKELSHTIEEQENHKKKQEEAQKNLEITHKEIKSMDNKEKLTEIKARPIERKEPKNNLFLIRKKIKIKNKKVSKTFLRWLFNNKEI